MRLIVLRRYGLMPQERIRSGAGVFTRGDDGHQLGEAGCGKVRLGFCGALT